MIKIISILMLKLLVIICKDPNERETAKGQYSNIFQTVPVLLEHFIEILQDKPEVLEKDDAKMFTADSSPLTNSNIYNKKPQYKETESRKIDEMDKKLNYTTTDHVWELTSERIIEKTLEVESLLEEYNE